MQEVTPLLNKDKKANTEEECWEYVTVSYFLLWKRKIFWRLTYEEIITLQGGCCSCIGANYEIPFSHVISIDMEKPLPDAKYKEYNNLGKKIPPKKMPYIEVVCTVGDKGLTIVVKNEKDMEVTHQLRSKLQELLEKQRASERVAPGLKDDKLFNLAQKNKHHYYTE